MINEDTEGITHTCNCVTKTRDSSLCKNSSTNSDLTMQFLQSNTWVTSTKEGRDIFLILDESAFQTFTILSLLDPSFF